MNIYAAYVINIISFPHKPVDVNAYLSQFELNPFVPYTKAR